MTELLNKHEVESEDGKIYIYTRSSLYDELSISCEHNNQMMCETCLECMETQNTTQAFSGCYEGLTNHLVLSVPFITGVSHLHFKDTEYDQIGAIMNMLLVQLLDSTKHFSKFVQLLDWMNELIKAKRDKVKNDKERIREKNENLLENKTLLEEQYERLQLQLIGTNRLIQEREQDIVKILSSKIASEVAQEMSTEPTIIDNQKETTRTTALRSLLRSSRQVSEDIITIDSVSTNVTHVGAIPRLLTLFMKSGYSEKFNAEFFNRHKGLVQLVNSVPVRNALNLIIDSAKTLSKKAYQAFSKGNRTLLPVMDGFGPEVRLSVDNRAVNTRTGKLYEQPLVNAKEVKTVVDDMETSLDPKTGSFEEDKRSLFWSDDYKEHLHDIYVMKDEQALSATSQNLIIIRFITELHRELRVNSIQLYVIAKHLKRGVYITGSILTASLIYYIFKKCRIFYIQYQTNQQERLRQSLYNERHEIMLENYNALAEKLNSIVDSEGRLRNRTRVLNSSRLPPARA